MDTFYNSELERLGRNRHQHAKQEVERYFGNGFLDSSLMWESPLHGATLVGLGQIQKDQGVIFEMGIVSMHGENLFFRVVGMDYFSSF